MPPNPHVPAQLLSEPCRRRDAVAAGVSLATLRGPLFATPFYGVRVATQLEQTVRLLAQAALLALPPGSVLSCHTAAQLRNLPVPVPAAVHAALPAGLRASRLRGIEPHVRDVPTVQVQGLPVSAPGEMFLELAEHMPLVDLVVVGDALVRRGWVKLEALHAAVSQVGRRRGIRLARQAVGLVRAGVDSPMETKVRLLVVLADLPCPLPGYRVIVDGQVIGWVDLALPAYKIVIEYDGDLHRTLKKKWRMDVATREALRELGWTVIVLTYDDYAVTPIRTLARLSRELDRHGCPDLPAWWRSGRVDERRLSAEWLAAFPGSGRQAWDWADAPHR